MFLASTKKSRPSFFVFQMCELEVEMSLVKVMTHGEGSVCTGQGGTDGAEATWGANMPNMPDDFADPCDVLGRLLHWENPQPSPTQRCKSVYLCVEVRV